MLLSSSSSNEPSWLSVKFDEVTDKERKALADFVWSELEGLEGNFVWEKFVSALVDCVADVRMQAPYGCCHYMTTQCWRWQKRQNGARQNTQRKPPPNNLTRNDDPSRGGHSHKGRTRRRPSGTAPSETVSVREILEEGDGRQ